MKTLNVPAIKTRLHTYQFDLSTKEGRGEHKILTKMLKKRGYRCFSVVSTHISQLDDGEVTLDCSHVFNDQWNTSEESPTNPSTRVFDWYEYKHPKQKHIVRGHYLDVTDEMKELREKTYRCGFCGSHYWEDDVGIGFCTACLDSPYLNEDELRLLRLQKVSDGFRKDLRPEEKEKLTPLYISAQSKFRRAQVEAKRKEVQEKFEKACATAKLEFDGMMWLMDRGINTDNVIFYAHDGTFCFGWRSPLSESVKAKLKEQLKTFPYEFTLK